MLKLLSQRVCVLSLLIMGAGLSSCKRGSEVEQLSFEIVSELSHDRGAYTQGLFFINDQLYETTGEYGESQLRKLDPQTGRAIQERDLDSRIFGEGSTYLNGKIYVLTWENEVCQVFDPESFKLIKELPYKGEGWGLTTDGNLLIMSNGSAEITFRDPATFAVTRSITVKNGGGKVADLNELEYVDGFIFSNVWHSDRVVKISPTDGRVVAQLDLGALMRPRPKHDQAVLNGIAYRPSDQLFYVTGKLWSKLYAIKLTQSEP